MLSSVLMLAQIKGNVYEIQNSKKSPLFGVNIYWENTSIGTISDENGYFEIKKDISNKLIFSFIGYQNDTLEITENYKNIEVVLANSNLLGEVVISERQLGTHYSRLEVHNTQTITGAELCRAACCNLSESFETNASVDASYNDAATGAKQIKLLGLSGKYVQMLTENIQNLYGLSQPYSLGYIPGTWMESIQVSKGTAAVINGYDAITGQINVEYKKPETADDLSVNQFFSSAGRVETNIDGSILINEKWSTMLFAHIQHDFMKLNLEMDINDDSFMDMPAITQYNFFNRWDYFGKNLTFRTGVKYIDETRRSGQMDYDFKNPAINQDKYGIYIESRRVENFAKIGWVNPEKKYQSLAMTTNFTGHFQNSIYGRKTFDANQLSFYVNTLWQSNFNGNEKHKYNTGLSLKSENLNQSLNDSAMNVKELVPGAYFQYTNHYEKLNYILGFRGDYHIQENRFLWTPRLNFKYNITGWMILRASTGKGYRKAYPLAENNFLLASSRQIIVNPDLKLEDAWNFGSNITFHIPLGKREMTLNAEYYRTQFINQIITDFEDGKTVKFYNLDGKSYSNTYQIEASYQIIRGLDFTTAFRYNDVKQSINGELMEVPLTSRYKGIITASYKTKLEKWQYDFTLQFNGGGRIPSVQDNPVAELMDMHKDKFPAYNIMNIQVTKNFKKWLIYAGCENVLNFVQKNPIISADNPYSENFDSSLIWGPIHGRMFYLGIKFAIAKK